MDKSPVLVSACLMGEACRYDGRASIQTEIIRRLEGREIVPVCPEVEGDLSVPRPPAEIKGRRVLRENGDDVSAAFTRGAERCLQIGLNAQAHSAILKSRSPACGCGQIYDGSFSASLIQGDGIFTQVLKSSGFQCQSDEDFLSQAR